MPALTRRAVAAALVLALVSPVAAQDAQAGIRATIRSQIDAFLRDDFVAAFDYASPSIRNMFRTPENFGAMVRNGYPMVWRPSDVRFGELREIAGALWQQVIVQDAEGRSHLLDYRMIEVDGVWRISGVQILQMPEVAA